MDRTDRAPSLPAVPCAGGSQSALSGTLRTKGSISARLLVVVLTCLEDGGTRSVDRLARGATGAQSAVDRKSESFLGAALGTGQRTGEQDPGAERAPTSGRLGASLRLPTVVAGNLSGCTAFSRDLLSSCQLDPSGTNARTR